MKFVMILVLFSSFSLCSILFNWIHAIIANNDWTIKFFLNL